MIEPYYNKVKTLVLSSILMLKVFTMRDYLSFIPLMGRILVIALLMK